MLPSCKIEVSFADGTFGMIDLAPRLSQGPLGDGFDLLCDEKVFSQVFLEHGALTWPAGVDLAPDAVYERIRNPSGWDGGVGSEEPAGRRNGGLIAA